MLFPRPRFLPAVRLPVVPPCLSERKEARQDSRSPEQGSERANLMKLQTGTRPQFTVIRGHAVRETRRGTAAGYSVHMGIFTDHSRNGQVWVYTLGTTHGPRILPPLKTSSWSPAQCHSCFYWGAPIWKQANYGKKAGTYSRDQWTYKEVLLICHVNKPPGRSCTPTQHRDRSRQDRLMGIHSFQPQKIQGFTEVWPERSSAHWPTQRS